ncbi:MAG: NBR1-Ig-like domain-containing protein [Chloroflexota bacterium]
MKRLNKCIRVGILLIAVALTACGGAEATPTQNVEALYTSIAETALAYTTQTALALPATPTASATPEFTNTPLVTDTPTATNTPFNLPAPSTATQAACDNSVFLTDVTIPDGSEIAAGSVFVKTWRVRNLGLCTWDEDYYLAFGWGGIDTNWSTVAPILFGNTIVPGEEMEISVTLKAPTVAGNYGATFRLFNDRNYTFGDWLGVYIRVP